MLLLSLLVMLSLGVRTGFRMLPAREPPGIREFREEAMAFLTSMDEVSREKADSLAGAAFRDNTLTNYSNRHIPVPYRKKAQAGYKIAPISLNKADSVALLPLPGIGPVFAGRIIKYRSLLGGFVDPAQLNEVYGMKRATVEIITSLIFIDSSLLRPMNLNSATFRELLRHPYLEYENVKALVHYRDVMGHISSFEELRQNSTLPDSVLDKAAPYLGISPGS